MCQLTKIQHSKSISYQDDFIEINVIHTPPPDLDDWGCVISYEGYSGYYTPETTKYIIKYDEVWEQIKNSRGAIKNLYEVNYYALEKIWDFVDQNIDEWLQGSKFPLNPY